jgi:hypothetical protein
VRFDVTPDGHPPIVDVSLSELFHSVPRSASPAGNRPRLQSFMAGAGIFAACAACCLIPVIPAAAAAGLGTTVVAVVLQPPVEAVVALGLAGAGALLLMGIRRKKRLKEGQAPGMGGTVADQIVCRLPPADRAQRTADFRALFSGGLVGRERSSLGVRWMLRAQPGAEEESRRLAALEERCCDGICFSIRREGDEVHWDISGPKAAAATLDVLFDLPVKVMSDEGADAVWRALDAAGCGPSTTRQS